MTLLWLHTLKLRQICRAAVLIECACHTCACFSPATGAAPITPGLLQPALLHTLHTSGKCHHDTPCMRSCYFATLLLPTEAHWSVTIEPELMPQTIQARSFTSPAHWRGEALAIAILMQKPVSRCYRSADIQLQCRSYGRVHSMYVVSFYHHLGQLWTRISLTAGHQHGKSATNTCIQPRSVCNVHSAETIMF